MDRLHINHTQFGLMFSVASITTVIVGPAGVVMAKVGTCTSALLCGFLCFTGSVVVYIGILQENYGTVLIGRFLFWSFLWMLQVVQNVLTYQNFKGSQLAAAYGLLVTACRFGGMLGFSLSGPLIGYFEDFPDPLADMILVSVTGVWHLSSPLSVSPCLQVLKSHVRSG